MSRHHFPMSETASFFNASFFLLLVLHRFNCILFLYTSIYTIQLWRVLLLYVALNSFIYIFCFSYFYCFYLWVLFTQNYYHLYSFGVFNDREWSCIVIQFRFFFLLYISYYYYYFNCKLFLFYCSSGKLLLGGGWKIKENKKNWLNF